VAAALGWSCGSNLSCDHLPTQSRGHGTRRGETSKKLDRLSLHPLTPEEAMKKALGMPNQAGKPKTEKGK
jgi:hypothetical protein